MSIAFDHLRERVQFMRKMKGERVVPVVELDHAAMKTKVGIKQRPEFKIVDWRAFGGSEALPAPASPSLPGESVAKPTSAEVIGEDLPWEAPTTIGKVKPKAKKTAPKNLEPVFDDGLPDEWK